MWYEGMFEKRSDEVNVTIEFDNKTRKTTTSYTIDGKWKCRERKSYWETESCSLETISRTLQRKVRLIR